MAIFYAAIFAMIGIHMPFWPVWLEAKGLSPTEIGTVYASSIGFKIIFNPLISHFADRYGQRRQIMISLALLALITFSFFGLVDGFWQILLISILFFSVWSPLIPLGESLAMLGDYKTRNKEFGRETDYGRLRLWGSITFIITAIGTGYLLTDENIEIVYQIILVSLALVFAVTLILPPTRAPALNDIWFAPMTVLKDKNFLIFIFASALIQASHGVYYAFGTLNWKVQGYSENIIGLLWAEGVVAEIILFIFGARLIAVLGPSGIIVLGGVAGILRWLLMGDADGLAALVFLQALHAFTFGATHLGAIYFIYRHFPNNLSASAQGVYSAIVMGLALGLSIFASGKLYSLFGSDAYNAMALMAAVGTLIAILLTVNTRTKL
jgi:PPP family 3-phenylpropionic acid transporter